MLRILTLFTFIFSFKVIAETYEISPLTYCPEFKIKIEENTNFHLTFKLGPDSFSSEKTVTISSLNNLSSVTQELTLAAKRFCPLSLEVVSVDGILSCLPESLSEKPFSKEYISFLNQIIKITDQSWNSCEHIAPLIKLQLEISQLDQNTILSLEDSNDLLKIFTDDEVDNIIDLYHTCGGKEGTKEFLTNFILLEGKKQCLYPSPPGLLSFEEFKKIANSIGEKYQEEGIIGLNSAKNEIMKDTVLAVTKTILGSVTKDLLEPNEINRIILDSKVITDIEKVETKFIADYAKYILPMDASLKIIDEALLPITKNKFGATFPDKDATLYTQDEIFPRINKSYQECIGPIKSEIKFDSSLSLKERINYLKKKEENFCKNNINLCNKTGCDSYRNYTTMNSEVKDVQRIQACLLEAFQEGFEPTLDKLLTDQYNNIKESLSLNQNDIEDRAKLESKQLKSCISKELESQLNLKTDQFSILHFATPKEFTKTIAVCGKRAERNITAYFTKNALENLDPLKEFYKNEKEIKEVSDRLSDSAIDKCTNEQLKRVDNTTVSASLCLPIIEMTVAQHLIPKVFDKVLNEAKIDLKKAKILKENFETCSNDSISRATKKLYNNDGKHPFQEKEKIQTFLERDNDFFKCFLDGLTPTTELIIEEKINEKIENLPENLNDREYALKTFNAGKQLIKECFNNNFKKFNSWPDFLKQNDDDRIEKIKTDCTDQATDYILPKIILNETEKLLEPLRSDLLLNTHLPQLLYGKELNQFQLEQKIIDDKKSFQRKHPELSQEEFINEFKKKTQKKVLKEIRSTLFATLEKDSLFDTGVYALKQTLTPQCFNDLYEVSLNWSELKDLKTKDKETKVPLLTTLSTLLVSGIKTAKSLNNIDEFIENIEKICSRPQSYSTLKSILDTNIAGNIIVTETTKEVKKAFIKTELDQCIKDIKELEMDYEEYGINVQAFTRQKTISEKICNENIISEDEIKRIKSRILREDREKAILFDFIVERKNKTLKAVEDKINIDFINKLMTQDSNLLEQINSNLIPVLNGSEEFKSEINQRMVELIFKDRSNESFSDKFLSAQIISAIGLKGYKIAEKEVENKLKEMETLPSSAEEKLKSYTQNAFIARWNFKGIKYYMDWENITEEKKKEIYTLIYDQKIKLQFNPSITEKEKEERTEAIKNYFKSYIDSEPKFDNPNFSSYQTRNGLTVKKGKEKLTFAEKFKTDIKSEVTRNYTNDVKNFLNPLN